MFWYIWIAETQTNGIIGFFNRSPGLRVTEFLAVYAINLINIKYCSPLSYMIMILA